MAFERVILEFDGDVAVLTLNHPESRNALSWALASELGEALDNLGSARALVITGAGKGFCSGGDMASEIPAGMGFGDMIQKGLVDAVNPMLRKLAALKIPVIAAVNGAAAGAGAPLMPLPVRLPSPPPSPCPARSGRSTASHKEQACATWVAVLARHVPAQALRSLTLQGCTAPEWNVVTAQLEP